MRLFCCFSPGVIQLRWTLWEMIVTILPSGMEYSCWQRLRESFMVMVTLEKSFVMRNDWRIQHKSLLMDFYVNPEWINGQQELRFVELKPEKVTGFYFPNFHSTCGRSHKWSGTDLALHTLASRRYLENVPSE